MLLGLPLLSLAVWVPIVFGVLVLATGSDRNARVARLLALIGAVRNRYWRIFNGWISG